MHASATATGARRRPAGPLSFSPAALRALSALALSRPGIMVDFDLGEGGDARAIVSRRRGQLVALVIAAAASRTSIVDHTGVTVATHGDDEAGIRWTLRCEVDGCGSA